MNRNRHIRVGVLLVAALAGLFWLWRGGRREVIRREAARAARAPVTLEPGIERSPGGALEGVVVDTAGRPVDGATVVLARARGRDDPSGGELGRALAVTRTAAGQFRFEALAAGAYALTAMAPRQAPASQGPITLAAGEHKRVELRLGDAGVLLSGRVLDVGGGPVPGATVRAVDVAPAPGGASVPRVFQAVAGPDGGYQLWLGRTWYSLTAEADGYAPGRDWFQLLREMTRDLRLSPAARLSGRVIERQSRQPVPEARLWLQQERGGGGGARELVSDGAGQFTWNDLQPGTYRVGARKGGLVGLGPWVSLGIAQTSSGVEVAVSPGFLVAGHVRGPGDRPVAGARVQLVKTQPPFERPLFARSDATGAFRIEGVLPAPWRLHVAAEGHARLDQALAVSGDVADLVLRLAAGASVKGTVSSADGGPVEGAVITVELRPRDNHLMEGAITAADGSFAIDGLVAGELTVTAHHRQRGLAQVKDRLGDGEQKVVALRLDAGASITGKVEEDGGAPAVGVRVEAQRLGGGMRFTDVTGPDGRYRIAGVTAGTITVIANSGKGSFFTAVDRPDQKTITLSEREQRTGVDLVVAGGRSISGVVLGPDGRPVPGAEVTASAELPNGRAPSRAMVGPSRAYSGPDGAFTLEPLGAGKHTLWAVQAGYSDGERRGIEGGATGVKLQLAPESTLGGLVASEDGRPVLDYGITLLPAARPGESADAQRERQFASPWEHPSDVVHDPEGRFFFPRVAAGAYELRVRTMDGSAGSLTVSVAAGERRFGLRIVVERSARLVGQVVDAESQAPLAGVEVRSFGPSSAGARLSARSDGNGAFSLGGVSPGETVTVLIEGDRRTHLQERRRVEVSKGAVIDLGTIRLARGDVEARIRAGSWEGLTGLGLDDRDPTVVVPRPGSPAALAGVKAGDVVVSIDGKDLAGLGYGAVEYALRGRPGSAVTLVVQTPGGPPRTVTFNRFDGTAPLPAPRPATAAK